MRKRVRNVGPCALTSSKTIKPTFAGMVERLCKNLSSFSPRFSEGGKDLNKKKGVFP